MIAAPAHALVASGQYRGAVGSDTEQVVVQLVTVEYPAPLGRSPTV
ncbi:MAG: hypothetical protein MZW92_48155 [Comamonadaceae bacterium]|nr:hypothetical protein [Comamonadaceae bacterium]